MFHQNSTAQQKSSPTTSAARISPALRLLAIGVLLTGMLGASLQRARASGPFLVNATGDAHDATIGDGLCDIGGGVCTLRAALEEANADPGSDTIDFNLPGGGVHVLGVSLAPLPDITDPVILDGTSNPNCAAPCIVLSGANAPSTNTNSTSGLDLFTSNSTIEGLIITSWQSMGIYVIGSSNTIQGNAIGFWPGNPIPLPNNIGIDIEGSDNLIGGATPAQRNVVSGNTSDGIDVGKECCSPSSSNVVQGNYIGTDVSGSSAIPNGNMGLSILNQADHTHVLNNLLSGNVGFGLALIATNHSMVRGNKIGTKAGGTAALGNGAGGVFIVTGATNNVIGGAAAGQGNTIAYNVAYGVWVKDALSVRNHIQQNSIYSNGGLGIDLGTPGVTPNDVLDPDTGPNLRQNFPALSSATKSTGIIAGRLNSTPSRNFRLEFFASPAGGCDPSGSGEGKNYLGSQTVMTNAAGVANFSFTSPLTLSVGQAITATATDAVGNTSEFSHCQTTVP